MEEALAPAKIIACGSAAGEGVEVSGWEKAKYKVVEGCDGVLEGADYSEKRLKARCKLKAQRHAGSSILRMMPEVVKEISSGK